MTREVWSSLDRENMARIKIACGIAMTFGMNTYDIADGVWSEFEIPEEAPSPSPYMN
jgi:hypothetical protein